MFIRVFLGASGGLVKGCLFSHVIIGVAIGNCMSRRSVFGIGVGVYTNQFTIINFQFPMSICIQSS